MKKESQVRADLMRCHFSVWVAAMRHYVRPQGATVTGVRSWNQLCACTKLCTLGDKARGLRSCTTTIITASRPSSSCRLGQQGEPLFLVELVEDLADQRLGLGLFVMPPIGACRRPIGFADQLDDRVDRIEQTAREIEP